MSWTPKERRARRPRKPPGGQDSVPWEALAWFDLPEASSDAYRERALASIRRAGRRFGIRITPVSGQAEAKPARRNTLLD